MEKKSLDGLKGIASIMIVIFHYTHFGIDRLPHRDVFGLVYTYGWYLVDMFFIISGYLFWKVYAERIIDKDVSLAKFVGQRMLKLWPLFLLTTFFSGIFNSVLYFLNGWPHMHKVDLYDLVLNLVGMQSSGAQNDAGFNGPAWYLGTLVICYVVYYIIVKVFIERLKCRKLDCLIVLTMILVVLYKGGYAIPLCSFDCVRGYMGFALGGLVHIVINSDKKEFARTISYIVILITIAMGIVFNVYRKIDIFGDSLIYFSIAVWPSVLIICCTDGGVMKLLGIKPIQWIASISFSLYLWHFVIEILFLGYSLFVSPLDFGEPVVFWSRMAISILVAIFSRFVIEPPLNNTFSKFFTQNQTAA